MKVYLEEAHEKLIAYTFIQRTDNIRTGKLKEYLYNQFYLGVKSYPRDLENAKSMIINYKNYFNNPNHTDKKNQQTKKYLEKESDEKVSSTQKDYNNVKCYSCGKMGHLHPIYSNKIK